MQSGRKMSKTLGNGVDPLDVINEYSADALRFSVISGTTMGNDIRYMPEKLEQASNFANKLWNAAKFITMNLAEDEKIKSKYRIIWIIVSILNHIYRFYIYYCIINKSKIITLYANIFEKNRNFDF